MSTVIHWFRRDLRVHDNIALAAASAAADRVIPVFVLSDWKGSHAWTGPARQQFLCESLADLAESLKRKDGRLIIRCGSAGEELRKLLEETEADGIYFNRDPDPFGREMEGRVERMAKSLGRAVHSLKDVVIHERDELLTQAGEPYRVFTPYAKAWTKLPKDFEKQTLRSLNTPQGIASLDLPTLKSWELEDAPDIVEGGETAARKRMFAFLRDPIFDYKNRRDLPGADSTSRLSQDLRWGLLSIRELHSACAEAAKGRHHDARKGVDTYVNELIWREFYMQILHHYPEVLDTDFNPKYRDLRWRDSDADFKRWCEGATGFPIVDAGMRQLAATGFMHNRARMITAMFLTKDLRIHWKRGEQHFMQRLADGEISSNNGGWQWSAGTGADAAPYFRIQNPWTQTKRYDSEGEYIKRWVPELRDVDAKQFQSPPDGKLSKEYPAPMVDHAEAREAALAMFGEA